jgi:hypothetical protein
MFVSVVFYSRKYGSASTPAVQLPLPAMRLLSTMESPTRLRTMRLNDVVAHELSVE